MKLELTASVKIYQKEELTMIMITSLLKFLWSLVVWGIPVSVTILLGYYGYEREKETGDSSYGGKAIMIAIVYITAAFCIGFVAGGEIINNICTFINRACCCMFHRLALSYR